MDQLFSFLKRFDHLKKHSDILTAFGVLAILILMIIPMPAFMLDLSLSFSITLSLLVLVASIYVGKSLDFSIFPTLLLVSTLFRLAINVASTRVILSHGHEGTSSAGGIIEAFGSFVVGNNYAIGLVVFTILVVINFIVITKGSGRVAEVAARFTLDAMPGKQMSIDADLNAGLINDEQARARRKEIEREADFYGAMDGASKFVRGDAIAGILITVINIIGGLIIGVVQRGLDVSQAAEIYTKLTIGDGLVTQIPALIVSTAAGTVVTRSSSGKEMGAEMMQQLFFNPRAVGIVSGVMFLLSLVPGLPFFPFFSMGAVIGMISWFTTQLKKDEANKEAEKVKAEANRPKTENIEALLPLDLLELEVGYGLINIVESQKSGDLLERIVSIRKQFALDLGIVVPKIHIRDNLQLEPGEYRILVKGNVVGKGKLRNDCFLAMDPGNVTNHIEGTPTKEPAFGLDALWIQQARKEEAEMSGYTVVDLPTVMATHLTELIRSHAHELLGRQEGSQLIENFKKTHPKVVEDLIPTHMTLGGVVRVLQSLLKEQVSIRDLLSIMEALADEAPHTKDVELLTESVRKRLARSITRKYTSDDGSIPVISLASHYEETISNSLLQTDNGIQLVMDPKSAHAMITDIAGLIESHPEIAAQPILLTTPTIRRHLRKLTERFIPQLIVLSHNELTSDAHVTSVGTVELRHVG